MKTRVGPCSSPHSLRSVLPSPDAILPRGVQRVLFPRAAAVKQLERTQAEGPAGPGPSTDGCNSASPLLPLGSLQSLSCDVLVLKLHPGPLPALKLRNLVL